MGEAETHSVRHKLTRQSPEQIKAALEKARQARQAKTELRLAIANGEVKASAVLGEKRYERIPVRYILASIPGIGQTTAERVLSELGIKRDRRCKGLGALQRERLVTWLTDRGM